jgi:hypothetical protein
VIGRGRASLTVAAVFAALLVPAADALAQGSAGTPGLPGQGSGNLITPFAPQGPTLTQPTTTPTVVSTSTNGAGLTGTDAIAIGIGAVLVLGGISFFIWRDARKRAPVRQHAATAAAGGGSGPRQRPQKSRKLSPAERRRRKRGKAR